MKADIINLISYIVFFFGFFLEWLIEELYFIVDNVIKKLKTCEELFYFPSFPFISRNSYLTFKINSPFISRNSYLTFKINSCLAFKILE
jgi:hypothetical protein